MAEEKKPGLLKRIFSFGFGKKENAEPEVKDTSAAEQAARLEAETAAKVQAGKEEAERLVAEKAAQKEAERQKAEVEAAEKAEREAAEKLAAEKKTAEEKTKRLAAEQKAAKEKATEEKARLLEKERQAAEKAETERLEAETKQAEEETTLAAAEAKATAEQAEQAETERRLKEQLAREEEEKAEAERIAEKAAVLEQAQKDEPEPEPEEPKEDEGRKQGWFKRLHKGLSRSSSSLTDSITSVFTKKKLDDDTLQDLEDILIQADLGVETAMSITDVLASQRMGKDVTDEEVRQIMADEITRVLEPVAQPLELDLDHQPHVILVVGVNGSGKTTTIGKISQKLYNAGFSTLLVAGDTFRAAAVEQLHIWGDRTQAPVMSRESGADAAGLAFDAYTETQAQKKDVMLMDTAGRLQNKKELMDELEKIIRVLKKQDPSAPHTVLLTLDATTGQNALNQVEIFRDVAGVNGLVMTKLDGTARGGILVAISAKHKLPVYFIGVGEQVEDLEPFEADVFANAIAGLDQE